MSAFARLTDVLRVNCPGAIDSVIAFEIWNAADDICRDSAVYAPVISVALTPGVTFYPLTPPFGRVHAVFLVSHKTYPTTRIEFDPDTRQIVLLEEATATHAADPLIVTAMCVPLHVSAVTLSAVEAVLPADFWFDYYDAISHGAMARMCAQPAKPYTNLQKAMLHARMFKREKNFARAAMVRGRSPNGHAWRFPIPGRGAA